MIYLLLVLRRTPKGLGRPVLEEAEDFIFVVALSFLQEAGVLDVEHLAGGIEDHEDGEAKATWVIQTFQHGLSLGLSLLVAWVVVDVNILKVLLNEGADGSILGNKVGKAQTPRAPVASHLTDNELPF